MKPLLYIVAVLFVAISLAMVAMEDPGYVLISRAPWTVEMPLSLFVLLTLVGVGTLYLAIYWALRLVHMPSDVARWRQLRQQRRAQEGLQQGLIELAEGDWVQAEKRLLADLRFNHKPLVNYLGAALAAQAEGDFAKRNEYLANARRSAGQGEHRLAVGLMQARLQLAAGEHDAAFATLNELRAEHLENPQLLRLLAEAQHATGDWAGLVELLPELKRQKAMLPATLERLETDTHRELLSLSPPGETALQQAWRLVPPERSGDPALVEPYARHLIAQGRMDNAADILRTTIERQWSERLVRLYGLAHTSDLQVQIAHAERWLTEHRDSAALQLCLARLLFAANRRGRALEHAQRAFGLRQNPEAQRELALILAAEGRHQEACEHYRAAAFADGAVDSTTAKDRARTQPGTSPGLGTSPKDDSGARPKTL